MFLIYIIKYHKIIINKINFLRYLSFFILIFNLNERIINEKYFFITSNFIILLRFTYYLYLIFIFINLNLFYNFIFYIYKMQKKKSNFELELFLLKKMNGVQN